MVHVHDSDTAYDGHCALPDCPNDPSNSIDREDLLKDGEAWHGEVKYKADELYMVGRPDAFRRYPIFDSAFQSPMAYETAKLALETMHYENLNELPSLRYRLYRVSIEAV